MLMETAAASDPFVASLPVFAKFEGVADVDNYRPLPDDWMLATQRGPGKPTLSVTVAWTACRT